MNYYKIAAIPPDGIGPEVIDAGLQVLEALKRREGTFELNVTMRSLKPSATRSAAPIFRTVRSHAATLS